MKILRIQGKNLASIAGEFEVDFTREPLRSAGIFAICGPTGSGKSTLLDAMCLALFNNTPRTTGIESTRMPDVGQESILQGDRRQILRRGTTEARAAVDFIAVDGKSYRSVWRVWRANYKPTGKLQPAELRVYELDTLSPITSGISEAENKLTQLTGLTYNQFTRTVLLAQNEFARFLKARKDEKAEVLEKLTGTEIYSVISNTVYTKTASIRTEWKTINDRIGNIRLLTDEELAQLKQLSEELQNKEKELQQKKENIVHKISWYEQLTALQQNQNQAKAILQQQLQKQQEALPRMQRLQLIDSLAECRPSWQTKNELSKQLYAQQQILQECVRTLAMLTVDDEKIQNQARQKQALFLCHTHRYDTLKPQLSEARQLDMEIQNVSARLQEYRKSHQTLHQTIEEQEKIRKTRQEEIEKIRVKLDELKAWFDKNRQHEYMCVNFPLIDDLLYTIHQVAARRKELEQQLTERRTELSRITNQRDVLHRRLTQLKKTNEELTSQSKQIRTQTDALNISNIRQKRNDIQRQKEGLLQALMQLQARLSLQEELRETEKTLHEQQQKPEPLRLRLQEIVPRLEAARTQYATAQHLLEKARLAASASVSELRKQLVKDTPCPVCGSLEHPYAGIYTLSGMLQPLQQETTDYEKACRALENEQLQIGNELLHLQETIGQLLQNVRSLRKQCDDYDKIWKDTTSAYCLPLSVTVEQINTSISRQTRELQQIGKIEEEWEKQTLNLRQIEQNHIKTRQELDRCYTSIEQLNLSDEQLKNAISKDQGLSENLHSQSREALDRLSDCLHIPGWEQRLHDHYETFREELSQAATKWQHKQQQQEELEKQSNRLHSSLQEQATHLQHLCQNEAELRTSLTQQTVQLASLRDKRSPLLEGKPTESVEQYWQELLEKDRKEMEQANLEKEKSRTQLAQVQGQHKQISSSVQQIEAELRKSEQQLDDWLRDYNLRHHNSLSTEMLAELLQADPAFLQSERLCLDSIRDRLTEARTTLNERETQLQRHLQAELRPEPDTEPLSLLQTQLQQLQEISVQTNEQKTNVLADLRTHQENFRQSQGLRRQLTEISQLLEQWSKLDELIGSQSGYKFKEIAQGYTLDILLSYANKQLCELTPRYQLQRIPNELALQIIDHDLCDEARSVFSLSGGESFLVSLALALGLSSFASRNHYEENLFIDEGFGTLDTETLQIVMEALERLRSQGRQVGIISHVQELTERIPVRICLIKTGNGKSKVEVTSDF